MQLDAADDTALPLQLTAALSDPSAPCTLKITDFGLSSKLDDLKTHVSGVNHGTPYYLSPELMSHNQLHKASDVYAYGIIMWEMATGCAPYVRAHPACATPDS